MAGNNLMPQVTDDHRGRFRYGPNRKVEMKMRQELDSVANKTYNEIAMRQEAMRVEPVPDEVQTARRLQPEFQPTRVKKPRKTKPYFQDDFMDTRKQSFSPLPVIPPVLGERNDNLRKSTDKEIISALKKPHVTTTGLAPGRISHDAPNLNVIMEGKPAKITEDDLARISEANDYRPVTPSTPQSAAKEIEELVLKPESPPKQKPAILGSLGTTQRVVFSERRKPAFLDIETSGKKTRSRTQASVRSAHSSLRSVELNLPDESVYSKYDQFIEGLDADNVDTAISSRMDEDRVSSAGTVKSVKDLIEEAKQIVAPGSAKSKKNISTSTRKSSPKRKSPTRMKAASKKDKKKGDKGKAKGAGKDEDESKSGAKTGRTVDEIIASLKDQSKQGIVTDADRRIQEIMNRVMSQSSAVLGTEIGDKDSPQTETPADDEGHLTDYSTSQTPYTPFLEGDTDTDSDAHSSLGSPLDIPGSKAPDVNVPEEIPEEEEDNTHKDLDSSRLTSDKVETSSETTTDILLESARAKKSFEVVPPLAPPSSQERATEDDITSDEDSDGIDIEQFYDDLSAPPVATYEDIISVQGEQTPLQTRSQPHPKTGKMHSVQSSSVSFLSTWAPAITKMRDDISSSSSDERPTSQHQSVHHFCTVTSDYQLPLQFQGIGRRYHSPGKFSKIMPEQKYRFGKDGPQLDAVPEDGIKDSKTSETQDDLDDVRSIAARRVIEEANLVDGEQVPTLETWEKRANTVFAEPQEIKINLTGTPMAMRTDESKLFWTPAPPKLDIAPAKVKDVLFPDYQSAAVGQELQVAQAAEDSESDFETDDEGEEDAMNPEEAAVMQRILGRRYKSSEDLTDFIKAKYQRIDDIRQGKIDVFGRPVISVLEKDDAAEGDTAGEETSEESLHIIKPKTTDDIHEEEKYVFYVRRAFSQPKLLGEDDETLLVPMDYNTAMAEIGQQKQKMKEMKLKKLMAETEAEALQEMEEDEGPPETPDNLEEPPHIEELTPAEIALREGRNYVILPKQKKKSKKPVSMARIDDIQRFLEAPAHKIVRSESFLRIKKPLPRELRVPEKIRTRRRNSLPDLLSFEEYKKKKHQSSGEDEREWVRSIWNGWFDEVFPPTPPESDYDDDDIYEDDTTQAQTDDQLKSASKGDKSRRRSSISSVYSQSFDAIEPIDDTEENRDILQILWEEVGKISQQIISTPCPKAFDLARRGALLRKLGQLKKAEEDLNKAIEMEPMLLDAYWHRHLLYLLQEKKQAALEDLTFIMKKSRGHAGAYRSMAEIYRKQDEVTMAIINYTQAIKLNPSDHEAHYRRAEMYEKRGEMLLALEDYSKATKLQPKRTDALMKHGMYYFENENWNYAVTDFTDVLKVDPLNAKARIFRAKAYAKLGQWKHAVEDLSASIHLDPNSWDAFFQRGCILRKLNPMRALQDFSTSLLINNTEDNILSYLHRGILYNSMGKPEDAIPDFESVLKLRKDVACAHVNLGLIFMTKFDNYHRAIKKFTSAIKVDPTYVRAYVCRGEAFHKTHDLKSALRDFTKAIHLKPDVHHYYLQRGQIILELGNLELASFCVKHVSELGQESNTEGSLGQRPTQQAVVQSFLKSYDKAVDALQSATRLKPTPGLFNMLGKTQMKAKQYKDAIVSFEKALEIYKPWKPREPWPQEASEVHYLIGQCNTELRNYNGALDAFNNAIKLDGNFAEAFFQRGLTRIRLKQSKGIQDFNRALAIDPTIFQAYLSRACYYGLKGNYTKAILNCNEALKIQPNSVRSYLYRGALKYHIKAYELAIKDLTKAASIDNTCALAYFNRAVCYQESKHYDKALQDYGIVLLLGDSLSLKVLINRGLLYFEKKDFANAVYDFGMAARLCPQDHRIHHTLGLCYHKLGKLKEAVTTFTECFALSPFFLDGLICRGNVYMDFGTIEGLNLARRDYERTIKLDPVCLPARVNVAYTLQVQGKLMQAWRQFTAAIAIKPNYRPALEGRAVVNLQMSDTFAAYQDISAAIKVAATAELLTNRGVINQFMGDKINAMSDYQAAIQLDPTYSLAYFNAANIYFHNRHFRQALAYYDKTIQYNPLDESAILNRAITKVMLRDSQGALEDFKSAIKLSPYSAHMYQNRGNLYASLQQYEKAEKDFSKALFLQPDEPQILKRRADVRGKLGQKETAIEDYKRAIELQSYLGKL